MWPKGARYWAKKEILNDCHRAKEDFRKRRLDEPKELYLEAFESLEVANKDIIGCLDGILASPPKPRLIADAIREKDLLKALRYLASPPISKDDFETLSEVKLAWTRIEKDPAKAEKIQNLIRLMIDPKRFPWIVENRQLTPIEIDAAILASTVAAANQKMQTSRRGEEREMVESAVRTILITQGFKYIEVKKSGIQMINRDAPKPGEFTSSVLIGDDNADFAVGLYDYRLLVIECKGSNSELNSRKRINKEVLQDAMNWVGKFGPEHLVPAAAIQGVFKPEYIEKAQDTPLLFFWAHRLNDLENFLNSSR